MKLTCFTNQHYISCRLLILHPIPFFNFQIIGILIIAPLYSINYATRMDLSSNYVVPTLVALALVYHFIVYSYIFMYVLLNHDQPYHVLFTTPFSLIQFV